MLEDVVLIGEVMFGCCPESWRWSLGRLRQPRSCHWRDRRTYKKSVSNGANYVRRSYHVPLHFVFLCSAVSREGILLRIVEVGFEVDAWIRLKRG